MTQSSSQANDVLQPPSLRAARTVGALMLREMSARYGNSPGGYLWSVLQPLGMVLVLSVGFSLLLRSPSLGTSFLMFYATGYLPFIFYAEITSKTSVSLQYSRTLLAYPGVVWIDSILARFILNFVTSAVVFCIVISGIMIMTETRTILSLEPIFVGLAICTLVGLGVGLMNAVLFGLVPIWERIWPILSRPMFIASGVLFLYEDLPEGAQNFLWWNPLLHGTGLVRMGFYPTYHAEYVSVIYCFLVSLSAIALGLIFLRSKHKKILEI